MRKFIISTPFVQVPTGAYLFLRRRLEASLMTLGLGLLCVGAASIFFRIIGFQADVRGLMLPFTLQALLMNDAFAAIAMQNPVVLLFSALAFAPIVEEFIFRDLVLTLTRGLSDSKRQVIMLALCGVAFGLAHGHPFKIMVQGVFGMLLGLLYLRNGPNRLVAYGSCVFAHAAYNFLISVFASG